MRYEKGGQLIELARHLAASAEGMTLDEMAQSVGTGRRTAERMRDALEMLFPQLEAIQEGTVKRFRIPKGLDGFFQAPATEELLELSRASASLRQGGHTARAEQIERLDRKVRAALRSSSLRRLATDVDVLARAEATTARAGPRPFEEPEMLSALRQGIMAMAAVRFRYLGGSKPGAWRTVCPYGILFERMNYLVAAELGSPVTRTWRLDRIRDLEVTDTTACPPESFDLAEFAAQSFGVYQDEPENVVLKVLKEGVEEARGWRFHGSQTLEEQPDGTLLVRFTSSGMLELAWHLFTWEDKIQILAPARLRKLMAEQLQKALRHHNSTTTNCVADAV